MDTEFFRRHGPVTLRPRATQFVINELPWLLLCPAGLIYGGIEDMPLARAAILLSAAVFLILAYRFIYLRRISYEINGEQLTARHGVLQRSTEYIELYRVVDFQERQSLMQQVFRLKTVTVFSTDRTTPRMDLIGLPQNEGIVETLREWSEYNRQRKGIYEIANR